MPRHHEIQIRFIRRLANGTADPNPARDDILRITSLGENSLRAVYTERSEDVAVVDITTCTTQQLLAYLYRAFWATSLDEDPFQSVQLFVPGFPTFIIEVATLKHNIPSILDLVMSVCWNWPTVGNPDYVSAPERYSSHLLGVRGPEQTTNSGNNTNGCDGTGGTTDPGGLHGGV